MRYAAHCLQRDEDSSKSKTKELKVAQETAIPEREADMDRTVVPKQNLSKKRRDQSILGSCCTGAIERAEHVGIVAKDGALKSMLSTVGVGTQEYRRNGGNIRLMITLTPCTTSRVDRYLALALHPPLPRDFGAYVDLEGLPQLDLQELFDDAMDVKMRILDYMLMSTIYWFSYILKWQSPLISGLVVIAFATAVWMGLVCDIHVLSGDSEAPALATFRSDECVPLLPLDCWGWIFVGSTLLDSHRFTSQRDDNWWWQCALER
jgi:hypothetical protein